MLAWSQSCPKECTVSAKKSSLHVYSRIATIPPQVILNSPKCEFSRSACTVVCAVHWQLCHKHRYYQVHFKLQLYTEKHVKTPFLLFPWHSIALYNYKHTRRSVFFYWKVYLIHHNTNMQWLFLRWWKQHPFPAIVTIFLLLNTERWC